MEIIAIDTNVLVTLRLKRKPGLKEIQTIFKQCHEGKLTIFIPDIVFPETEWVLRSTYKQPKENILTFLEDLLQTENIVMRNKKELHLACTLYATSSHISLTDAIILAQLQNTAINDFITLDVRLHKFYEASEKKN